MALELLFDISPAEIGSLTIDATLSEEHSSEAEVTDHPIEQGADVSDHKRVKPNQIRINGVVSNTPLAFLNFNSGDRAVDAWGQLLFLQHEQKLLTVVTTLNTFENMAIVSLTAPRDAKRGHMLEFTAVLREIFTAESQNVKADNAAAKPTAQGKRPTPPAPAPVQASILAKAFL